MSGTVETLAVVETPVAEGEATAAPLPPLTLVEVVEGLAAWLDDPRVTPMDKLAFVGWFRGLMAGAFGLGPGDEPLYTGEAN